MEIPEIINAFVPFLIEPLVLIGFCLLIFFSIHRALLSAKTIPMLSPKTGGKIVQLLINYRFLIAILVIMLGFGLQFYKTHLQNQESFDPVIIAQRLVDENMLEMAKDKQFQQNANIELRAVIRKLIEQKKSREIIELKSGNINPAVNIFKNIVLTSTNSEQVAVAHSNIAALYLLKDQQKALMAYKKSVEIKPTKNTVNLVKQLTQNERINFQRKKQPVTESNIDNNQNEKKYYNKNTFHSTNIRIAKQEVITKNKEHYKSKAVNTKECENSSWKEEILSYFQGGSINKSPIENCKTFLLKLGKSHFCKSEYKALVLDGQVLFIQPGPFGIGMEPYIKCRFKFH